MRKDIELRLGYFGLKGCLGADVLACVNHGPFGEPSPARSGTPSVGDVCLVSGGIDEDVMYLLL